jgi:YHS domain-containing protein
MIAKKYLVVVVTLLVVALLAAALWAAAPAKKHTAKAPAAKKVVSAVCPVMGTKIPDVSKAAGKSVYKGKTYYFCCAGCKPKFDKNPEKYIKQTKAQPKAQAMKMGCGGCNMSSAKPPQKSK